MLQLKKKVSQNQTKLQQTKQNNKTTKQQNNKTTKQTTIFLPKINKVFLRPILQNLKGRSVLDNFFFENDPLDELNQMPAKNSISLGSWSKTQNSGQNRIYPSLTRPQNFLKPFLKKINLEHLEPLRPL